MRARHSRTAATNAAAVNAFFAGCFMALFVRFGRVAGPSSYLNNTKSMRNVPGGTFFHASVILLHMLNLQYLM